MMKWFEGREFPMFMVGFCFGIMTGFVITEIVWLLVKASECAR